MAVRVDREGRVMRDYHTAQNVRRADPSKGTQDTVLSERFYLADADFLVGLKGERLFLERLDAALRRPIWPPFLGRKSFVPALPISEGVSAGDLIQVMSKHPWRKRHSTDEPGAISLRGVIETDFGAGEPRPDVPLSFISRDRRFGVRHVEGHRFDIPPIVGPFPESPHVP
jgi:CRISPR system Cascade subunit CasD